ncbi:MAG: energy transducer TonB [Cycloclasticus sp.]
MSSITTSFESSDYKPKSVLLFVVSSIVAHLLLAAFIYKTGVFSTEDIDSIPSKTISIALTEATPIQPPQPVEPPKPKTVEKKRIVTQAPSPKKVYKKPDTVKKTPKPLPPVVKKQATSLPLPSPVKQPVVFSSPQPTYQPKPKYPAIARRRGIQGTVLFEISVANNGHVNNAIIIQSSGSSALDRAAAKAIKTWQFPASKFNSLTPFKQRIEFRLNGY